MTDAGQPAGCARCWPDDAAAAWTARRGLAQDADLVDESHYHLMILSCSACGQRFASVFTEVVDWADGDDSQYWQTVPLSAAEAADLRGKLEDDAGPALESVAAGRRSLRYDHPKGQAPKAWWGSGVNTYH